MRIITPKEIDDMFDAVIPYMFYTNENGWALRPDAPQKIVEMKKKIDEFWMNAKRDAM